MIARIFKFAVFILQLLFINALWAVDNPTVKFIGIEHGLSNNSVMCVYQDYKGFMWFGTYDGLNRYDGYNITVFRNRIGDTASLNCNEIYSITGDKFHNIWIGGRKGISVYDPLKNIFSSVKYIPLGLNTKKEITGNSSNIIADAYGNVFVPTDKDGFLVFDNNSKTGKQAGLESGAGLTASYRVSAIEANRQSGGAWLIVQNVGLCSYDDKTKTIRLINNSILQGNCLKEDNHGNLWFGTDNGLYRYNILANTFSQNFVEGNYKISCICIDKKGVVWIGSDGKGVMMIPPAYQKAIPFLSPDGKPLINSVAVYSICEDGEGRKWIGTVRGGVNIVEPGSNPFHAVFYGDEKILNANNNFVQSFCEDEEQNIWIGTGGGGLRYWNRRRNWYTVYTHDPGDKTSVGGNFITGIVRDAQNNIWVSSWFGGISRFNKSSRSFEHYPCYNPYINAQETRAWFVYEDRQKRLWCSTSNDGTIYLLDREANRFNIFDSSLVNIQCMAEDREGNLWGGNYTELIKIDPLNKKHRHYNLGYTVRSIHEDKEGNLWVGTQGGGLLLFDRKTGTYKRFDEANGLKGNTILRILEDGKGDLWMSSFTGLIKMDVKQQKFWFFSKSDGLQSNQFNFNAAMISKSGEFLFGGLKGFNIFYPDSIHSQVTNPAIFLTGIRVGGHELEANSSFITASTLENINAITVPFDSAALSFDFVAPEFGFPDKIQYAYYLQGWDKDWNYTGQVRTANYNHINEGTYHLRIKCTNAEGTWSKLETTLTINVLPPWYRSWWAWLVYVSAVALLIYLFVRYKARQAKLQYEIKLAHLQAEKEKELTEKKISFFTHISHEFRTPLTLIINPLKDLVGNKDNTSGDNDISMIYRNAKRLLSLADQLLLFRKVESIDEQMRIERLNISELCNEVYLSFSQHSTAKNIEFVITGMENEIPVYVDKEKIEIILFNLVSNAFKYTSGGGKIELNLAENERSVNIYVKDNGSGIPTEVGDRLFESFYQFKDTDNHVQPGFGIGLYVSQKLALAHGGSLAYSSTLGKGTIFNLLLLKGKTHFGDRYISDEHKNGETIFNELMEDNIEMVVKPFQSGIRLDKSAAFENLTSGLPSMLIVDDNEEMRSYIKKIFINFFIIYEADDGITGYKAVEANIPDIIISDVMMKNMNGVELCKKIKENPSLAHIPIVLLTASSSEAIRLNGIEGGAEDYIVKPFDKDIIVARIKNILKGRTHLHQYYFDAVTLKPNVHIAGEHKVFIENCIKIVEAHLDDPDFNIQSFCREIGMSHPSLYKKVKAVSGQTVNVFIRHLRLRRAAELLINTNKTITEVTYITGFNDIKYFREQFQKLFEINPSAYVKRYRKVLGKKQEEN
ncbi:MAG: two-component regulator propeller domain-containing protein [Ferruginibacter sp.]